jgi:glycosyltransferase involved in cell wall biosynthesis
VKSCKTYHAFYAIKPIIPRSVQILLRKWIARRKRQACADTWPIDPNSAIPPSGWCGWPAGKQFALALSHDVDTATGYRHCLKLAAIEEQLGFRSQFNFVPERYGNVSIRLLNELRERGFGIGVHGLKHDGKYFISKSVFKRRAYRINSYFQKWETRGYTAPAMLRRYEWMHSLDMDYCISTFDTDPFEPQPDGAGTIFPYWVQSSTNDHGFVELPYTLPQDFTIFILLGEKTIDIWRQKLGWLAAHGGMALLNTHPDYMTFCGESNDRMEYPVDYYIDFLRYVQQRYTNTFYHVLPEQIASFCRSRLVFDEGRQLAPQPNGSNGHVKDLAQMVLSPKDESCAANFNSNGVTLHKLDLPLRRLRVAMLSYSFYESDNRVRRYAETLARRGGAVDVIALRIKGQPEYNELNGVKVYRVQERARNEKGRWAYLTRIIKFFFRSAILLTRKYLEKPYDLVHVHSIPDFEVFAALVPKILGARVILDIHDILPEFYINKFKVGKDHLFFKILLFLEKASIGFSDHTIISNDLWRERLLARSVTREKCTTILNYPDCELFRLGADKRDHQKIVLMYPGTLNSHQGLDIAIRAFAKIKNVAPHADFHIYGDGPAKADLADLIRQHAIQDRVFLKDPTSLNEIVAIMAAADIGVIPKLNDQFGGEAFSTKTLEFMTLGVPIIVSRTRIDEYYFDDSLVKFFESGSVDHLAEAMLEMIENKVLRDRLAANALIFSRKNSWGVKNHIYLDLVGMLLDKKRVRNDGENLRPSIRS